MSKPSERLKELRISKKLTIKQLAKILKLSPTTIYRYENGKTAPRAEDVLRICAYFFVRVDYFLGIKDNPEPYNKDWLLKIRKQLFDKKL